MWGRAIKLAKDNWCLIVPRPYEVPHECDRLYPGAQGRNIYQSTCSSVAKTDLMHALHFQYKYSGMQSQSLRFPCCKIREASRGTKKMRDVLGIGPKGRAVQSWLLEGGQSFHSTGWNQEDFEGVTKLSPTPSGRPVYFCMEMRYMFTQRHARH